MDPTDPTSPSSLYPVTSSLLDVLVLCGGQASRLGAIASSQPKPLVSVCGKPLVWHCVKPWVDAGVRHLYILAPPATISSLEIVLSSFEEFRGASFTFLQVATGDAGDVGSETSSQAQSASGSADALRAYHQYKQRLPRTDPGSAHRDALVVSCDTVCSGPNIWSFIRNFYDGFYSAAALYYEPVKPYDTSDAARDMLAVEPPAPNSTSALLHARVHMIDAVDAESDGTYELPAGAIARRLHLTYTTAFADAHVYLLRAWVLAYTDFHRDIGSIREDLMPRLAGRQLPSISPTEGLKMPGAKLEVHCAIPLDTVLKEPASTESAPHHVLSIARLNAVQQINPPSWDESRVAVSIVRGSSAERVMRVDTIQAFRSYTREVLAGMTRPAEATAFAGLVAPFTEYDTYRTLRRAVEEATAAVSAGASPMRGNAGRGSAAEDEEEEEDGAAGRPRMPSTSPSPPPPNREELLVACTKSFKYCSLQSCPPPTARLACCVVEKNVEIGDGAKLRHVVLMQGSRVGPNVVLENVILCPNAEALADASSVLIPQDGEPQPLSSAA